MEDTGWKWKNIWLVILYFIHFLISRPSLSLLPLAEFLPAQQVSSQTPELPTTTTSNEPMDSFMGHIGNGLSQCHQTLQTVYQNFPVDPISVLKTTICSPIFIENIVRATDPLKAVSRSSTALIPVTLTLSTIKILLAENKMDQFGNEVCSLTLGVAGAAIGSAIGAPAGPPGMIIGAGVGGISGGLLGDWVYGEVREWLFTKGEDGVRPIDRIAEKFRAATDTLKVVAEVIAIIMRGQAESFAALLEHWQRVGGIGSGPGLRGVQ